MATKADIARLEGVTKAETAALAGDIARVETSLIKWIIGTVLATTSAVFVIARYVNPV